MGQYLYVEILAGLPLTAAMAELLALGRGAVGASWQASDPHADVPSRMLAAADCGPVWAGSPVIRTLGDR